MDSTDVPLRVCFVEIALLESRLLASPILFGALAKPVEDLSIFTRAHENLACGVHRLHARGDVPVRSRNFARQEIQMCVGQPQRLGIELAMPRDELARQGLPAVAQYLPFFLRLHEGALRRGKELLLLFFDALAMPQDRRETKDETRHYATA